MFQASSQVLDAWVVHVLASCESLRDSDVMCASKCILSVLNDSCFIFIKVKSRNYTCWNLNIGKITVLR